MKQRFNSIKNRRLAFNEKDLTKVFQICKIKKYATIKRRFSKLITSVDSKTLDKNKIINIFIIIIY